MSDKLTPKQRSYCMSCVKGKDTSLEKIVRSELYRRGYRFRKHRSDLPGKPDIAFINKKVAVFIDGDFWHGYRFNQYKQTLKVFWKNKISETIKRDKRNFTKLKRMGWKVIRIWGHSIKKDINKEINKIELHLIKK